MTKKEYEKKIDELQAQIDELRYARIDETKSELSTPPHPRWKPEQGYYYYCVEANLVSDISFYYNGGDRDALLENEIDIGNVFRTKSEAEFAVERLKVLAEMREWAGNSYDGAYIFYHRPTDQIITNWDSVHFHGGIRFKSTDDAENCIKAVGKERIKKYYFMITEEKE